MSSTLRRKLRKLQMCARIYRCPHEWEAHASRDEAGTTVYICKRCPIGSKVT